MFRLQVTIIRQTFQYMDMPCLYHFTLFNVLLCFDWKIFRYGISIILTIEMLEVAFQISFMSPLKH